MRGADLGSNAANDGQSIELFPRGDVADGPRPVSKYRQPNLIGHGLSSALNLHARAETRPCGRSVFVAEMNSLGA